MIGPIKVLDVLYSSFKLLNNKLAKDFCFESPSFRYLHRYLSQTWDMGKT